MRSGLGDAKDALDAIGVGRIDEVDGWNVAKDVQTEERDRLQSKLFASPRLIVRRSRAFARMRTDAESEGRDYTERVGRARYAKAMTAAEDAAVSSSEVLTRWRPGSDTCLIPYAPRLSASSDARGPASPASSGARAMQGAGSGARRAGNVARANFFASAISGRRGANSSPSCITIPERSHTMRKQQRLDKLRARRDRRRHGHGKDRGGPPKGDRRRDRRLARDPVKARTDPCLQWT